MNILFVCTGNTCRSPIAEYITKAMMKPGHAAQVCSAGIMAYEGAPMAAMAQSVLQQMNIPYAPHHARSFTPALAAEADYIFALEARHLRQIEKICPEAMPRAHTLKGYAAGVAGIPYGNQYDIADPYGQTLGVYNKAAREISAAIKQIIEKGLLNDGGNTVMKLAFGCDHAALQLKKHLMGIAKSMGHEVEDCGCYTEDSVDYPDFAVPVCRTVVDGKADRGILLCYTGIGISISANKMRGIRCSLCNDPLSARLTREHNDANVLALGAGILGEALAEEIFEVWLTTQALGGRHAERVKKMMAIETITYGR